MSAKAAVVTGATRGIGRGIAQRLLREGWRVLGTGTATEGANASLIEEMRQLGDFHYAQCRLNDAGERHILVERAFSLFGAVDALINNAGMAPRQRVDMLELTEEAYDELMSVNLKGPFFLTQAFARRWVEAPQAQPPVAVFITSVSAFAPSTNRAEYCLSKAGLSQAVQLYASRLSGHGICVYEVRPGIIETDMTAAAHSKYDALIGNDLLPIARWGQPGDVASAVWACCSGLLGYSTGEVLHVDGGFHMRRL